MSNIYDELDSIEEWLKYYPLDHHYYTYDTNIIFAATKIVDLYYQISNARMSLHFYNDFDNYPMMSDSEFSTLFSKKYFIENALLYYNFSVDYLWQVLWLRYDNSDDIKKLATNEKYEQQMKECNFEALLCALTELQEKKLVMILKDKFSDKNPIFKDIRNKYNYLKHRAIFHTPELGMNDNLSEKHIFVNLEGNAGQTEFVGYKIPLLSREDVALEDLKKVLLEFDKQFVQLCEDLFFCVMPSDFRNLKSVEGEIVKNYTIEHIEELVSLSKENPLIRKAIPCHVIINELLLEE